VLVHFRLCSVRVSGLSAAERGRVDGLASLRAAQLSVGRGVPVRPDGDRSRMALWRGGRCRAGPALTSPRWSVQPLTHRRKPMK
jgi:hypothetical protein